MGVDVEEIRDSIDAPGIARAVFSEPELELLSEASPHEQDRFFYRTWVRKEAVLKACALGLTVEPRDLSVWADAVNAEGTAWDVREVEVGDRYAAAVAAPGKDWSLRCFEYSWMAVTSPQGLSSQEIPG